MRAVLLVLALAACDGVREGDLDGDCRNLVDDDEDGLVDCEDPGCDEACTRYGPPVWINEFMASNQTAVEDVDGAHPDWLELYSEDDEDVELGGYTITDDLAEPGKHLLDDELVVPAGGYLLLWADSDVDQGIDHLGFNLSRGGEHIGLFTPEGDLVDRVVYDEQYPDWAAMRWPDGGEEWVLTDRPSPGEANLEP